MSSGVIHNVHSQVLCLWSPILRCIIASYPAQQLLESTHGLAYLLHVDGNSQDWTALLDFMYPVAAQSVDWVSSRAGLYIVLLLWWFTCFVSKCTRWQTIPAVHLSELDICILLNI